MSGAPGAISITEDDYHVELSIPWRYRWKLWGLVGGLTPSLWLTAFYVAMESPAPAGAVIAAVLGLIGSLPMLLLLVNTTVVAASRDGLLVEHRPFGIWPLFSSRMYRREEVGFLSVQPWTWNRRDGKMRMLQGEANAQDSPWRFMYAVMLEHGDGTADTVVWFVDTLDSGLWIKKTLQKRLGG